MRVVISNGLHRFPLARAASEIADTGQLELALVGGYPTERVVRLLQLLGVSRRGRFARLIDRQGEIPEPLIKSVWSAEVLSQLGALAARQGADRLSEYIKDAAMRVFAQSSHRVLATRRIGADIYHYRSGFGLRSVDTLKMRGAIAVCDHSAVHPLSLEGLFGESRIARLWHTVLRDLDRADHVVVNSPFVKETFIEHGWAANRVHVVYLGIDDAFLRRIRPRPSKPPRRPSVEILFTGWFDRKKGAADIENALCNLDDVPWQLCIAGPISVEARRQHARLLTDDRVTVVGNLPRFDLPRLMQDADMFILPSLADGSPRAVWEALAAGLFVVTTPTSGSIVADDVHGALVPAKDPGALATAIRRANEDRRRLYEVGLANADLIRQSYTQKAYGQALLALYGRLLADRA